MRRDLNNESSVILGIETWFNTPNLLLPDELQMLIDAYNRWSKQKDQRFDLVCDICQKEEKDLERFPDDWFSGMVRTGVKAGIDQISFVGDWCQACSDTLLESLVAEKQYWLQKTKSVPITWK